MNKENKITINNLLVAVLFLVLGIILLTTSEDIITLASKIIGILLIIFGIVKTLVYVYMKGKLGEYQFRELLLGILIIGFGVLFIIFSSTLGFAIRTVVGVWTLFAGINRIILALSVRKVDALGFKMYLTTSIIMILVGCLLISGLFDKIVGLFIIIYAVTEIVDYIYYKSNGKNFEVSKETKNKKKTKLLKSSKVVDAVVEEDK